MKRSLKQIIEKYEEGNDWSVEEDQYLRQQVNEYGVKNWKIISKGFCKKFKSSNRTPQNCREHWNLLQLHTSYNEEVLILLLYYGDNLELASTIFKSSLKVEQYIKNLILKITANLRNFLNDMNKFSFLEKLQFYALIDIALNSKKEYSEELEKLKNSQNEWIEIIKLISNSKNLEEYHTFVQSLIDRKSVA